MKNNTAADFYFRISIWTFACLILAMFFLQVDAMIFSGVRSEQERTAVKTINTIRQLQTRYAAKNHGRFAANFDALIISENLDEHFSGQHPVVNGYTFSMTVPEPTSEKPPFYSISADPLSAPNPDDSKLRHFYFDSTLGVTQQTEENRPAKADDPTI
jgi:hypothetical protein